jgi:hypothetical protein
LGYLRGAERLLTWIWTSNLSVNTPFKAKRISQLIQECSPRCLLLETWPKIRTYVNQAPASLCWGIYYPRSTLPSLRKHIDLGGGRDVSRAKWANEKRFYAEMSSKHFRFREE